MSTGKKYISQAFSDTLLRAMLHTYITILASCSTLYAGISLGVIKWVTSHCFRQLLLQYTFRDIICQENFHKMLTFFSFLFFATLILEKPLLFSKVKRAFLGFFAQQKGVVRPLFATSSFSSTHLFLLICPWLCRYILLLAAF
jgi:hypothetical protein